MAEAAAEAEASAAAVETLSPSGRKRRNERRKESPLGAKEAPSKWPTSCLCVGK